MSDDDNGKVVPHPASQIEVRFRMWREVYADLEELAALLGKNKTTALGYAVRRTLYLAKQKAAGGIILVKRGKDYFEIVDPDAEDVSE